mmetsp:Transcript_7945/g.29386  ORF Transcript_7945/g.29386 Transcript_7945/m.29386 type:complete len:511 (+) Transcript_7945:325-1857(+)
MSGPQGTAKSTTMNGKASGKSATSTKMLKVLLVEDDLPTQAVVAALLRSCQYEVTTASDGEEALREWRRAQKEKKYDFILSDHTMPGMTGFELMQKMQESDREVLTRKVPFIMMSARDDADTVMKCLQGGAADYLVKPIRKNELKNLWTHVWRNARNVVDEKPQETTRSGSESLTPKTPENSGVERASLGNGLLDQNTKADKAPTADEEVVVTLQRARAPDEPADAKGTMTVKLQLRLHPMIPGSNKVKLSAQEGGSSAFKAFSRSYMAFKPHPALGNGGMSSSMIPPMMPSMSPSHPSQQQRSLHPLPHPMPSHEYVHGMPTYRNGHTHGDVKHYGSKISKENGEQRMQMPYHDQQQRSVTTQMENCSSEWVSYGDEVRTSGARKRDRHSYENGDGGDTPTWKLKKLRGEWKQDSKGRHEVDQIHSNGKGLFEKSRPNHSKDDGERDDIKSVHTENGRSEHSEERRAEAVRKYKEKRMNRCFEKKVRYQSRKRVAESRPRVLGRFVKAA